MSLPQMQEEILAWHNRNFEPWDISWAITCMQEEAGEVSRAALKRFTGHRGTTEEWTVELRKEVGDVLIALSYVASLEGFDLQQAFEDRWAVIQQRDWKKDPKGHGIVAS